MSSRKSMKSMNFWRENEVFGKRAFVILLETSGCSWRSCYMCGYNYKRTCEKSDQDLINQIESALLNYKDEDMIKIFTSGSFLDDSEINTKAREKIMDLLPATGKLITIESRPEFVTEKTLETLKGRNIEVAIGLESSNNMVLKNCVNKGFKVEDFVEASKKVSNYGFKRKAYLLLKPPFLSEKEALIDLKNSIDFASRYADTISINPVNIQNGTLVKRLWIERKYRPPWLWSLVDALIYSQKYVGKGKVVVSMPSGAGRERGIHNCFACDSEIIKKMDNCRIKQNYDDLKDLSCDCIEKWKDSLALEKYVFGNPIYP